MTVRFAPLLVKTHPNMDVCPDTDGLACNQVLCFNKTYACFIVAPLTHHDLFPLYITLGLLLALVIGLLPVLLKFRRQAYSLARALVQHTPAAEEALESEFELAQLRLL